MQRFIAPLTSTSFKSEGTPAQIITLNVVPSSNIEGSSLNTSLINLLTLERLVLKRTCFLGIAITKAPSLTLLVRFINNQVRLSVFGGTVTRLICVYLFYDGELESYAHPWFAYVF